MALFLTVCAIDNFNAGSSGIFGEEFHNTRLQEWTEQAVTTFPEATESYMVDVIGVSHFRSGTEFPVGV
jgi:hypothetical protein